MSQSAPGSRLRYPLGRDQRLRGPREFARTRETGERRVCGCLIVNWRELPEGSGSRLGVITGRRIGSAVVRNRARRLMRTAFRLNQHRIARPVALILVARASINTRPPEAVDRDFRRCLREAGLWTDVPPAVTLEASPGASQAAPAGAIPSTPSSTTSEASPETTPDSCARSS